MALSLLHTAFSGPFFHSNARLSNRPFSQFTTGYSMVLNLLYTRTLEEARAFLDRSFAAYLGGQGVQVGCWEGKVSGLVAVVLSQLLPGFGIGLGA